MAVESVRPHIAETATRHGEPWAATGWCCTRDLNRLRGLSVQDMLQEELGALSDLETEVLSSIRQQALVSANADAEYERSLRPGDRLADRMAAVGGSWPFLVGFGLVLVAWVVVNSVGILRRPFDPYPYILLNLVLSCLAAVQAPVIMMSQNRQAARDRAKAEQDYMVNLKAEIEIRHLHQKMDHLVQAQWRQLLEIQQTQLDVLTDVADRLDRDAG